MGPYYVCCGYDLQLVRSVMDFFYILRYCGTACVYFFLRWGSIVYSLWFVQWDFTRLHHPGNLGGISGSGPVSLVSELYVSKFLGVVHCCATHPVFCIPS